MAPYPVVLLPRVRRHITNSLPLFTNLVWEFEVEGGAVLARPDIKGLFLLNPTAREIWSQSSSGASPEDTVAFLVSTYGIPYDIALRDVNATLQDWRETLLADHPPELPAAPLAPAVDTALSVSLHCRLHGKHFLILLPSGDLADEIAPRLEPLLLPPSQPHVTIRLVEAEDSIHLFHGDHLLSVEENPAAARAVLLQEMVRLSVSDREFLAILHAAACGTASQCVIFPAATHSGKTTLSAVLMHSGFSLYADDSVALDRQTVSIPAMPFALMLREGSWPAISARFPSFEDLPGYNRFGQTVRFLPPKSHAQNARASAIVFSRWQKDANTNVTPLNAFEALVRLKESGFWLAHDRASIERFLNWLQSLPLYEMIYSDVDEAVSFVKQLLSE